MLNPKRNLSILALLVAVGVVVNVSASLYIAAWWQQEIVPALTGALSRSLVFLVPVALAVLWRPARPLHAWVLQLTVAVMVLAAAWLYLDLIAIDGDRKRIFIHEGVKLAQWVGALAGLLAYGAVRGAGRLRHAGRPADSPDSDPERGDTLRRAARA